MSKIHIGKKIKEAVDKSGFTVSDFAGKISVTRDAVYKIYAKDSIATDQLQKISQVLEHDFFRYYQSEAGLASEKKETLLLQDPKTTYGFATKEDIEILSRKIEMILTAFEKFKKESSKRPVLSVPHRKKSKKK